MVSLFSEKLSSKGSSSQCLLAFAGGHWYYRARRLKANILSLDWALRLQEWSWNALQSPESRLNPNTCWAQLCCPCCFVSPNRQTQNPCMYLNTTCKCFMNRFNQAPIQLPNLWNSLGSVKRAKIFYHSEYLIQSSYEDFYPSSTQNDKKPPVDLPTCLRALRWRRRLERGAEWFEGTRLLVW